MTNPTSPAIPALSASAHPLRWPILATLVAAQFMFVVDAFIVNVATPAIRDDLHASPGEIGAVIAIYQIAYASLVITGGRLGDLFGGKRLFLIGLAGFTLSSLWCGVSRSSVELIFARLVQGSAAALTVPQVLGTIHALFTDEAERARAFGIFGVALGLGGAAGFVLGGLFVTWNLSGFGWRLIFFVNVPVGIAIAVAATRLMPPRAVAASARLDVPGAVVLFLGLVATLGPVMFGREAGWSGWLLLLVASGAAFLLFFLGLQRSRAARGAATLVDPALIDHPAFRLGAGATFCFFAANVSFYFVTTVFMQIGLGFTALQAGLAVLPLAVAFTAASRGAAARVARRGPRALIQGCLVELAGLAVLAGVVVAGAPTLPLLTLAFAVFGIGQGLVMAPLFATVLAGVPRTQASAGAGLLATVQQAGNATGVALLGALYFALLDRASHEVALLSCLAVLAFLLAGAMGCLSGLRASNSG